MRRLRFFFLLLLAGAAMVSVPAQRRSKAYEDYIRKYRKIAVDEMKRYHVPASITLAQGLLESGAGKSQLARKSNNHFGIKCGKYWEGRTVRANDDAPNECFRAYRHPKDSYRDHSKFLRGGTRYASLFKLKITDYKGWARGLKRCGYATSPTYANQLINIIELYKLHHYDKAKKYDKFMVERSSVKDADTGLNLHPIHIYNKNYYLKARPGDTFRSIGKEVGISYKKIAKYNERDKDDKLVPGEIIYLKKKQKKAEKTYKRRPHRVKAGESMYSIAQYYGIRLSSLYKMNDLGPDYSIQVGDLLKVR